jgi:hypothetical protein
MLGYYSPKIEVLTANYPIYPNRQPPLFELSEVEKN